MNSPVLRKIYEILITIRTITQTIIAAITVQEQGTWIRLRNYVIEFRISGVPTTIDDDIIPFLITNNYLNETSGRILTQSSYTSNYQS